MTNKFPISNFQFSKTAKAFFITSAIVLLAAGCNSASHSPINPTAEQRIQIQVSHKVDGVDMGDQLFNFYADENKTAMDLLKSGHMVETKSFGSAGEYVTSINGKKEDTGKNFWALYVNGSQSSVGASDYRPVSKDRLEWKLEEIKN